MSEFSTEASIIAQTSGKIAGEVVAALVAKGEVASDTVTEALTEITKNVFNDILGLAGAESIVDVIESKKAQQKSSGGSRQGFGGGRSGNAQRRGSGGGGSKPQTTPAETAFNFGDHEGKTIAEVFESDPEYIEWYAEQGRNDFMQKRCATFLESA